MCILYKNLYQPKAQRNPKIKVGERMRIFIYKQPIRKGYLPYLNEEIFVVTEVLEADPVTDKIQNRCGEVIAGTFYESVLVRFEKQDDVWSTG